MVFEDEPEAAAPEEEAVEEEPAAEASEDAKEDLWFNWDVNLK